jgi:hypothetical protein
MPRISIRTGMAYILLFAVGIDVIRGGNDRLLPMLLGAALVGVLIGHLLMAGGLVLIDLVVRGMGNRGRERRA